MIQSLRDSLVIIFKIQGGLWAWWSSYISWVSKPLIVTLKYIQSVLVTKIGSFIHHSYTLHHFSTYFEGIANYSLHIFSIVTYEAKKNSTCYTLGTYSNKDICRYNQLCVSVALRYDDIFLKKVFIFFDGKCLSSIIC